MYTVDFQELKLVLENTSTPLYAQIEREIRRMIETSRLRAGDKIPGNVELAEMLGISTTTVRKAFSLLEESGLITRTRRAGTFVSERETNLRPTIGFLYTVDHSSDMINYAQYFQVLLSRHGYDLKIVPFDQDYYENKSLRAEIWKMGLHAAILFLTGSEACRENISQLDERGFPYIRYGSRHFEYELRGQLIRGNETQATRDALVYLRRFGHKRIGIITEADNNAHLFDYMEIMSATEGFRPDWCLPVDYSEPVSSWSRFPQYHGITGGYLDAHPELTAVVVVNTSVCLDLLQQTHLRGIRIPADLSVIALHDYGEGVLAVTTPGITAMHQSREAVAEICVDRLIGTINGGLPDNQQTTYITYDLVERQSVLQSNHCP